MAQECLKVLLEYRLMKYLGEVGVVSIPFVRYYKKVKTFTEVYSFLF